MRHPKQVVFATLFCAAMAGASCGGSKSNDPVAVAQVAVRANPDLELVATDERQGVLTVKFKRTGQIVTVRADDVVAGTAFRDLQTPPPAALPAPMPVSPAAAEPPVTAPAAKAPTAETHPSASPATAKAKVASKPATSYAAAPMTPAGPPPEPASQPTAAAAPKSAGLDESRLQRRTTPVNCSGNERVRVEGVLLEADRVAVNAVGDCHVVITGSKIVGHVGVLTAGNATVDIEDSSVQGTVAIQAMANSVNTVKGSTIIGRVHKMQNGEVRDLGQNVWR